MSFYRGINRTTAEGTATYSSSTMSGDGAAADLYSVDLSHDASSVEFPGTYRQPFVAHRGTSRGRVGVSSRGSDGPLGRGGTPYLPKRTRTQYDDDDYQEDIAVTRNETTKRRKVAPEPEVQRTEVHRRRISLRDRLIKGVTEPQEIGMRAYKLRKG